MSRNPQQQSKGKAFQRRKAIGMQIIKNPTTGPPSETLVKLRYVTRVTLNPTVGVLATHSFRTGSLFDPDFTGTGHQPMGFDTYASMYNNYIVRKSTIKATGVIQGVVGGVGMLQYGIMNSPANAPPSTDPDTITESGLVKIVSTSNTVNTNIPTAVRSNYDLNRDHAVSNYRDNRLSFGAHISSNPSNNRFFHLMCWNTDATVDQLPVLFQVQMDFDCSFSDRSMMPAS